MVCTRLLYFLFILTADTNAARCDMYLLATVALPWTSSLHHHLKGKLINLEVELLFGAPIELDSCREGVCYWPTRHIGTVHVIPSSDLTGRNVRQRHSPSVFLPLQLCCRTWSACSLIRHSADNMAAGLRVGWLWNWNSIPAQPHIPVVSKPPGRPTACVNVKKLLASALYSSVSCLPHSDRSVGNSAGVVCSWRGNNWMFR
jgi:hypothetical protein